MQNEQIWVAEFQSGITPRLCQGSQNLEFLRTTTKKKKAENKNICYTAGDGETKGKSFHLGWENTLATSLT